MGLVKDMFVRVNGLTFLVDFYVLNMDVNSASSACDLFVLLGRPFLKTAKAVIDVDKGSLTLRHKEKCDFFFYTTTTTYPAFFSCIFFQNMDDEVKYDQA